MGTSCGHFKIPDRQHHRINLAVDIVRLIDFSGYKMEPTV